MTASFDATLADMHVTGDQHLEVHTTDRFVELVIPLNLGALGALSVQVPRWWLLQALDVGQPQPRKN